MPPHHPKSYTMDNSLSNTKTGHIMENIDHDTYPGELGSYGQDSPDIGFMLGVTCTPGNEPNKYNSWDGNIHIMLNRGLSQRGLPQTFSHEAYGHAYLYSMGYNHRHIFNSHGGSRDGNRLLAECITRAIAETILYQNLLK